MREKSIDSQIEEARMELERQELLLAAARVNVQVPHNPVGMIIAKASLRYREITTYDTDQNLGMIEAMRDLKEQNPDS